MYNTKEEVKVMIMDGTKTFLGIKFASTIESMQRSVKINAIRI